LLAKSWVLQSKKVKSSKILLLFYNVLKNPYGKSSFPCPFFAQKEEALLRKTELFNLSVIAYEMPRVKVRG